MDECITCQGDGEIECEACEGSGEDEDGYACNACTGTGTEECPDGDCTAAG